MKEGKEVDSKGQVNMPGEIKNKTSDKKYKLFMPVCSHCGRVRTAGNRWRRVPKLMVSSPFTELTHGLCPECIKKHYPDLF